MKIGTSVVIGTALVALPLLLAGCSGIEDVPYQPETVAAKIHESQRVATNGAPVAVAEGATNALVVPVVTSDPEVARYFQFSDVKVAVKQQDGKRFLSVYTELTPQLLTWRIALLKDGREIYHFNATSRHHFYGEAIPLEPLALDPSLPVPDKIVVTPVKGSAP